MARLPSEADSIDAIEGDVYVATVSALERGIQVPTFIGTVLFPILNESQFLHRIAPIGLVFAVVCYLRREQAIGGWLMFFYYQLYGSIFLMVLSAVGSIEKYMPFYWDDWVSYLFFLLAFLPRLAGFLFVGCVSVILLRHREWFWVRNLRLTLWAALILTSISLTVDAIYFPEAVVTNTLRVAMLGVWLAYFYVSDRVKRVFLQKDWA